MNGKRAFSRALACVSHPLSVGAILILFFNDHILRQVYPSDWTGKIGDFAWLFFFPFVLLAGLTWFLPRRLDRYQNWISGATFVMVGGVFILAKTLPSFHMAITKLLGSVLRFPVSIVMDPTDLIALVSLIGAAWLWLKVEAIPARAQPTGLAFLVLGVLLTVANMSQPDPGIHCLRQAGEEVVACSSYGCFSSLNGGLSWKVRERDETIDCPVIISQTSAETEEVQIQAQPGVVYSFVPGGEIKRSEDDGATWKVEYQIVPITQAQKAYYFKTQTGNPMLLDSPQEGVFDRASGNVIFTMGPEGVLVRQAQGVYRMVQVGQYGSVQTAKVDVLMTILSGELGLAACFGGLVVVVLGLHEERSQLKKLVSVLAGVIWLFPVFFVPPALSAGTIAAMLSSMATLVAGLFIFPLVLDGFFMVGILVPDGLLKLGLLVIAGICLFFMPYLLWGLNLLPDYRLATFFAVLLSGGFLLFQYRALLTGASNLRPEVPAQVEPLRLRKAGRLFFSGAVLAGGGIGMVVFGLLLGFVGVGLGLVLMIAGAWVRRKIWEAAKESETRQES